VYCGQTAGPHGTQVGFGRGDIVLDEDAAPPSKNGHSPHFSAHVYCGQTAGWIKMPLGTKVGLGPGHILLDEDPTPTEGAQLPSPDFWLMLFWPNDRPHQLLLSSCQNSLNDRSTSKFAVKSLLKIAQQLERVATLPCEISVFKKRRP